MIKERVSELMKSLIGLVDSIANKNMAEARIDGHRLDKMKKMSTKWHFHLNDDEEMLWPDDFEEDWE